MSNFKSGDIAQKMLSEDPFSQWLGIDIISAKKGYAKLRMTVRKDMLNSMNVAHGGITYALADSALAFAMNEYGRLAVSIDTSINHIESLKAGDVITAETTLDITKHKLSFALVHVHKGDTLVALFKGALYRTSQEWSV